MNLFLLEMHWVAFAEVLEPSPPKSESRLAAMEFARWTDAAGAAQNAS
jgi:hypothetical protein